MLHGAREMEMKAANKGSRKITHKSMERISNASSQVPTDKTPQTGIGVGNCTTHKMGGMK